MTDNAAKITGTLESAMAHLSAAENDLIRARTLIRPYATGTEEYNVRDVEGTVRAAKLALTTEINLWDGIVTLQEKLSTHK